MSRWEDFSERVVRGAPRFARLAFYVSLGPIAGPFAAMAVRYAQKGEPWLAALWSAAIPLIWLDLASATAALARHLHLIR